MSLDTLLPPLNLPDDKIYSLSHEDIGSWVGSLNSFFNKLGLGIHPDPPYFNNLILRADGTHITADFEPRVELVVLGTVKTTKLAIGCTGKGPATQTGTAEFLSKHSVALGTSEVGYKLQVDGTTARLYHGEEQVWIGKAKAAHGLDGTYDIKF